MYLVGALFHRASNSELTLLLLLPLPVAFCELSIDLLVPSAAKAVASAAAESATRLGIVSWLASESREVSDKDSDWLPAPAIRLDSDNL